MRVSLAVNTEDKVESWIFIYPLMLEFFALCQVG